jgi:hypothetical protein
MRIQWKLVHIALLVVGTSDAAFPSGRQRNDLDKLVNKVLADWHTLGMAIGIVDGEST